MDAWVIYLIMAIIWFIIIFISLLLILTIFAPNFYNSDNSINWLTLFWASLILSIIVILVVWIITGILECAAS
jgi:hypothetical protein